MKRFVVVIVAILVALPLLLWAGFRLWLVTQPPDFRAQVEQLSILELYESVRHSVAPRERADLAGYGRRNYPGRGDSPWVRRSALDGRPRILTAALTKDLRAAWSAETATLHLFWRGDVDYTGPVYDQARDAFGCQYASPRLVGSRPWAWS